MATDREFIVNKKFLIGLVIFVLIIVLLPIVTQKKTYHTCREMKSSGDTSYNAALDKDNDGIACE